MRSTSQKTRQMKAAVEAILFAMGGSVEVEKIAAALEMKVESTEELLADMMEQYKKEDRGIQIVELEHAYQLCTKKEMYEYLIRVAKQPKKATLSDVVLETLSIIAYKQPVTKAIVFGTTEEFLRSFGVQSLDELPVISTVKMEDFKAEAEEEVQLKLDI